MKEKEKKKKIVREAAERCSFLQDNVTCSLYWQDDGCFKELRVFKCIDNHPTYSPDLALISRFWTLKRKKKKNLEKQELFVNDLGVGWKQLEELLFQCPKVRNIFGRVKELLCSMSDKCRATLSCQANRVLCCRNCEFPKLFK